MPKFRILSAAEQVANHLRAQVNRKEISGEMPGSVALAARLGVNHKTVEAALVQLEKEGLLISRGARRARAIVPEAVKITRRPLRVATLLYESADAKTDYMLEVRHELSEAGHFPFYVGRTCMDIGADTARLARLVGQVEADAWLVQAGSREVLEWFSRQALPVYCMFGRFRDLDIAGTRMEKEAAYQAAVRGLVALGHRRIVLLARSQNKLPQPAPPAQAILDELQAAGIPVGDYHFPFWENTREGFHRCLEMLFRVTPPTALIVDEAVLFAAVQQFLAARGIRVPDEVSLVCGDPDPSFAWRETSVAHCKTDSAPWVNNVVRWAANISHGRDYRRKVVTKVEFVPGGTMGPPPGKGR